ncbi:uncharacterized protein I206_102072 [Kwoniella pini CBS 10737]|uniref:Uncharacterized protein n=1 Tax=Kwoniella pini CBS 10737 TaxID=1296096 RepID=A0A1B9HUW7_9TREE|nr:uncharacterized protein I206_06835 [Kwoniella pini CBS 10737]OCF47061.1 hypothetical protein I206_06835 [Kwoniella pini CBS 10737]
MPNKRNADFSGGSKYFTRSTKESSASSNRNGSCQGNTSNLKKKDRRSKLNSEFSEDYNDSQEARPDESERETHQDETLESSYTSKGRKATKLSKSVIELIRPVPTRRSLRLVHQESMDITPPNYAESSSSEEDVEPECPDESDEEVQLNEEEVKLGLTERSSTSDLTEILSLSSHIAQQDNSNSAKSFKRNLAGHSTSKGRSTPASLPEGAEEASMSRNAVETISPTSSHPLAEAHLSESSRRNNVDDQMFSGGRTYLIAKNPKYKSRTHDENNEISEEFDNLPSGTPSEIAMLQTTARQESQEDFKWADDGSDLTSLSGRSQHEDCQSGCCDHLSQVYGDERDDSERLRWPKMMKHDVPCDPGWLASDHEEETENCTHESLSEYESRDLAGTPPPFEDDVEEDVIEFGVYSQDHKTVSETQEISSETFEREEKNDNPPGLEKENGITPDVAHLRLDTLQLLEESVARVALPDDSLVPILVNQRDNSIQESNCEGDTTSIREAKERPVLPDEVTWDQGTGKHEVGPSLQDSDEMDVDQQLTVESELGNEVGTSRCMTSLEQLEEVTRTSHTGLLYSTEHPLRKPQEHEVKEIDFMRNQSSLIATPSQSTLHTEAQTVVLPAIQVTSPQGTTRVFPDIHDLSLQHNIPLPEVPKSDSENPILSTDSAFQAKAQDFPLINTENLDLLALVAFHEARQARIQPGDGPTYWSDIVGTTPYEPINRNFSFDQMGSTKYGPGSQRKASCDTQIIELSSDSDCPSSYNNRGRDQQSKQAQNIRGGRGGRRGRARGIRGAARGTARGQANSKKPVQEEQEEEEEEVQQRLYRREHEEHEEGEERSHRSQSY